jgi:hypothetical protein
LRDLLLLLKKIIIIKSELEEIDPNPRRRRRKIKDRPGLI